MNIANQYIHVHIFRLNKTHQRPNDQTGTGVNSQLYVTLYLKQGLVMRSAFARRSAIEELSNDKCDTLEL